MFSGTTFRSRLGDQLITSSLKRAESSTTKKYHKEKGILWQETDLAPLSKVSSGAPAAGKGQAAFESLSGGESSLFPELGGIFRIGATQKAG